MAKKTNATKKTRTTTPSERKEIVRQYQELKAGGMTAQAASKKLGWPYITIRTWEKKLAPAATPKATTIKTKHGSTISDKTGDSKPTTAPADKPKAKRRPAKPKASKPADPAPAPHATPEQQAQQIAEGATAVQGLDAEQLAKLHSWMQLRANGMNAEEAAAKVQGASYNTLYEYLKKARAAGLYSKPAPKAKATSKPKAAPKAAPASKPADKPAPKVRGPRKTTANTKALDAAAGEQLLDIMLTQLVDRDTAKVESTMRILGCTREEARNHVRNAYRLALADEGRNTKAGA